MSFVIIQHNVYKLLQLQQNAQILYTIDMFLNTINNTMFISGNQTMRQYIMHLQTKRLSNVQVLFETQIKDKHIKLIFKPTQLIKYNLTLLPKSQRCTIQLTTKIHNVNKSNKSSPYKFYLNKHSQLIIEINYFNQQFINQVHANFILNKTILEISAIIDQVLVQIIPLMRVQALWEHLNIKTQLTAEEQNNQQSPKLTPYDKIKYMQLLNQVYKNHRYQIQSHTQTKIHQISTIDDLIKTNNLLQQDTNLVQKIEKQKTQIQDKFNEIFKLLKPKLSNKKQHLNMYKMYLTQKQFQKHVKTAKKQHLQIYQITSMHYRIVKGVQNKILLNAEKLLTDNGAHANIFFGTYTLHLSDTLFHYQFNNEKEEQTEQKVVVKPLVCKRIKNNQIESSLNSFKNQLSFLYHCKDKRSKFIATYFLPIDKNKQELSEIFLEFYPCNLVDFLEKKFKNNEPVSLLEILKYAQSILYALIFMVENSALHRDLKPSNVMMDTSLKPRLIDFGSCCPVYNRSQFTVKQKRILTTPDYQLRYKQSPQIIRKKYNKQEFEQHILYDIYSFGISLKQMASYTQLSDSVGEKEGVRVSEILQMIVQKCKQPDPIDRVTFDELLFYISILKDLVQK